MRLLSTVVLGSLVALGAAATHAQDDIASPPGQPGQVPQANHGAPPGGAWDHRDGPRSMPSDGGAAGMVDSVSPSSLAITVAPDRRVIVKTTSATTYLQGQSSIPASAIATGERILALGIVGFDGGATQRTATITAARIIVQPAGGAESTTSQAPGQGGFPRDTPPVAKRVGEIPANYVEGKGTPVNGPVAYRATEAALTSLFPHGVIDRVVDVGGGAYECHNIAVRWPHHIFVNQDFKVIGAF